MVVGFLGQSTAGWAAHSNRNSGSKPPSAKRQNIASNRVEADNDTSLSNDQRVQPISPRVSASNSGSDATAILTESFIQKNMSDVTFYVWLRALLQLWTPCGLLRFENLALPYDHNEAFNVAVSCQSKDNDVVQAHILKSKEVWMIVGTLTAGLDLALLALLPAAEARSIFDQILALCAVIGFITSICGPVVLGGVLLLTASACDVQNFDLFMLAARGTMQWSEILIVAFNYATAGSVLVLPLVALSPRAELPAGVEWLRSPAFSGTCASLCSCLIVITIWHINSIAYLASRAKLFSAERAYEKVEGDSDSQVLDRLVATASSPHKMLHRRSYVYRETSRQATQCRRAANTGGRTRSNVSENGQLVV